MSSRKDAGAGCLRLGVIGTSIITENLINAAKQVEGVELVAIYSRTESRAAEFASKFPDITFEVFSDVSTFASSSGFDAVYIASPTSEHAGHSILCMTHGKHVFCEKPACSNSTELEAVLSCAKDHNVAFMEAMRCLQSPNFTLLKEEVAKLGKVRHFSSTACQLSSKWPAYLKGERVNAFLPELSNGALMDIGCYPVHVAVALLGPPKSTSYTAVMLETGVDGGGTLVLDYGDKVATLIISKMSQGWNRTEVMTESGTVSVDSPLEFLDVMEHDLKTGGKLLSETSLTGAAADLGARGSTRWAGQMSYEVRAFKDMISRGELEDPTVSWKQSRAVMQVLDAARRDAGIRFPADKDDAPGLSRSTSLPESSESPAKAGGYQLRDAVHDVAGAS